MRPDRGHREPHKHDGVSEEPDDAVQQQPEAAALTEADAAAQLAAADARAEDFHQKYLYALAEVENAKKRAQRQADERVQSVRNQLLLKFIPVLDNLERSLAHLDSGGLRAGLEAILRNFEDMLGSEGVTPILTTGEPFDPRVAEAIGTQRADGVENDIVIAEAQRGYRLGDRILRPAKVIVAKND